MALLFSFIVPVYNAKRFLSECLSSISAQTFRDFEVILIDDGSTDGSSDIAESFTNKDPRFRYVWQANQGTSGATNSALSLANGEYLINLDDDDYVDASLLETAFQIVHRLDPDIIQFQSIFMSEDGTEQFRQTFLSKEIVFEGNDNLCVCEQIMPGAFNRTHSRKVIRRSIVGDIRFVGNSKGADTSFLRRILFRCERVVLEPDLLFHVREVPTSESRKKNPPLLYKEWLTRELRDIDQVISEDKTLKRKHPFWVFDDLLDMFQLFVAKAIRENAYDRVFIHSIARGIWIRRGYLMRSGFRERIRWWIWLKHTKMMASRLSKNLQDGDFIV